jgi:hypothetical protein
MTPLLHPPPLEEIAAILARLGLGADMTLMDTELP